MQEGQREDGVYGRLDAQRAVRANVQGLGGRFLEGRKGGHEKGFRVTQLEGAALLGLRPGGPVQPVEPRRARLQDLHEVEHRADFLRPCSQGSHLVSPEVPVAMDDHSLSAKRFDREKPLKHVLWNRLALKGGIVDNVPEELAIPEVDASDGCGAAASLQSLL